MQCMDVQVINQAVLTHITNKHLVIRGLTTIGNLAFNNDINVQSCYQINMPYTIDMALYNHADGEDVHECALRELHEARSRLLPHALENHAARRGGVANGGRTELDARRRSRGAP